MTRQNFGIKVRDHRGEETTVKTLYFEDRHEYQQKINELESEPQAHYTAKTRTIVDLQPATQKPIQFND